MRIFASFVLLVIIQNNGNYELKNIFEVLVIDETDCLFATSLYLYYIHKFLQNLE